MLRFVRIGSTKLASVRNYASGCQFELAICKRTREDLTTLPGMMLVLAQQLVMGKIERESRIVVIVIRANVGAPFERRHAAMQESCRRTHASASPLIELFLMLGALPATQSGWR